MKYDYIIKAVQRLKRRYKTNDIYELCRRMKIILSEVPMGTGKNAVKGFYIRNARKKVITVNRDLPEIVRRYIIAHELGHAVLHENGGISCFQDVAMYDVSSLMEKEANLFAAEILMEDAEVLLLLGESRDFYYTASLLEVPPEFLEFKFRMMRQKGYALPEAPITARSNFLKAVPIPEDCPIDFREK